MDRFDVAVIGGGAAGMIAAGRAAERGKRVLLLEKNKKLGEKLKITGGGRCNITNAEFDEHILLKQYGRAASFLYSPFSQFGVQDTFSFFQSHGLSLVVQEGKRAFPKTERASDVCNVLEKYARSAGVVVKTGIRVSHLGKSGRNITNISASRNTYQADSVILATGGMSHPETGSTGDGFDWLRALGHTVHRPSPTIVPLAVRDTFVRRLAGVSLDPAKITFSLDGKKQFSRTGKMLFTHFGISGPMVLNSSGPVGDLLHGGTVTCAIDLFPGSDEKEVEKKIIALFDENKNKALKNVFNRIAPSQILSCIPDVQSDTKVHSITKEQRKAIVHTLKALPLTITSLMGLDRAVVVDGGVDLREIQSKTMRSRLYDNLYIIGDLLHINRPSGGYSLQLCWTTGFVAGSNV